MTGSVPACLLIAAAFAACLLLAAGCASSPANAPAQRDIPRLTSRAERGDGAAAYALYQYYEYTAHDVPAAARWLRRACEMGEPRARERQDWQAEYRTQSSF